MSAAINFLVAAMALSSSSAMKANDGYVDDPEKCQTQWEIRLEPFREMYGPNEGWPEQLILDANQGGDFKMAQRYMAKFGWIAAATSDPNDLTLYFMPDSTGNITNDPRFRKRPIPVISEGVKRACFAAWISGVPFVRVTKRGSGGSNVLYSVSTEKLPVNDF